MLQCENFEVTGWEHAIRGMRNPKNSWEKSDSDYRRFLGHKCEECGKYELPDDDSCDACWVNHYVFPHEGFAVGPNDLALMMKLRNADTDHRKFMRMITVYVDITAPLYWWKEFDTYKVGTVANSCSTMHKIHSKPIELSDFSFEDFEIEDAEISVCDCFINVVADCEILRKLYLETNDKKYWRALIQLLPESYNQKRTVMLNYEVLANIYKSRKNHRLTEWHTLCDWIESLPYSELITGGKDA